MRVTMDISKSSLASFDYRCNAAIQNVFKGTKKATETACREIMNASLMQVPVDTYTLMESAYYEVSKRTDISSSSFEAEIGYGGNGDPVNPKTGRPASTYMVAVHENLHAVHPIGKAKFLEDPIRNYAANNFQRVMFNGVRESMRPMSD